jgi:acetyl esterase/lipase
MPSLRYEVMKFLVSYSSGAKEAFKLDEEQLRNNLETKWTKRKPDPPASIYKNNVVEELDVKGNLYYKLLPKNKESTGCIVFLHGGGYFAEIGSLHWRAISKMLKKLDKTIYVPIYPLTPEHTYLETFDMMEELYRRLLVTYDAKRISLIGDSAGAQIALSFGQYLNEISLPQPLKIVLLSPVVALDPSEESFNEMKAIEEKDCMLVTNMFNTFLKWWYRGTEANNYLVSPLYGDFEGLGKIYLFSGTYDILNIQAIELLEKAKTSNASIRYFEGEKMMHVWPYLPFCPEGETALKQIISILGDSDP